MRWDRKIRSTGVRKDRGVKQLFHRPQGISRELQPVIYPLNGGWLRAEEVCGLAMAHGRSYSPDRAAEREAEIRVTHLETQGTLSHTHVHAHTHMTWQPCSYSSSVFRSHPACLLLCFILDCRKIVTSVAYLLSLECNLFCNLGYCVLWDYRVQAEHHLILGINIFQKKLTSEYVLR